MLTEYNTKEDKNRSLFNLSLLTYPAIDISCIPIAGVKISTKLSHRLPNPQITALNGPKPTLAINAWAAPRILDIDQRSNKTILSTIRISAHIYPHLVNLLTPMNKPHFLISHRRPLPFKLKLSPMHKLNSRKLFI